MSRIEDRLHDAFGAAAGTVRPESVAELPDLGRVTRGRHVAAQASPSSQSRPSSSSSPEVTTVPMVVGMTVGQATSVLQAAQLRVMITSQGSGAVPPGTVVAQSPVAGTRLISGATITVTVAAVPGSSPTPASGAAR